MSKKKPPKNSRGLSQVVKKKKGMTMSSQQWLIRQLNDPYVQEAKRQGYRSRAAFKLIELNDKLKFLKPHTQVIDLGAAPGGWTEVLVGIIKPELERGGKVIALDILTMAPIAGATVLQGDFTEPDTLDLLQAHISGPVDAVLSDMAPSTIGHRATDHLKIMAIVEEAFEFSIQVLGPGGTFVAKVFQGGTENMLLAKMKRLFRSVRHIKPPASRKDSSEMYVVAMGFLGSGENIK